METEPTSLYKIREAMLDDALAIRRMQGQSWRDTYRYDSVGVTEEWLDTETASWLTEEAMNDSRERYRRNFNDPTQFYRVAERAGEIVGFVHVSTKNDGTKHLWGLYTAKETHGSGLAQELMTLADSWIGDQDVDLEVATYNGRAKAFYRKHGFEEVPGENELFKDKIPNVTMTRKGVR